MSTARPFIQIKNMKCVCCWFTYFRYNGYSARYKLPLLINVAARKSNLKTRSHSNDVVSNFILVA